jgi:UDP-N-acetylglucosamine 1-carboxyvinyltransferase
MRSKLTNGDVLMITGGQPLGGTVKAIGNKNAALPMIAAALLTDDDMTFSNVPDIKDVRTMLEIAEALGVSVAWRRESGTLTMNAADLRSSTVPKELCSSLRAGVLFAAPLLVRTGAADMPPPGGDVIGKRRLDSHFQGLTAMGAVIQAGKGFKFEAEKGLNGADIFLAEASVTATEQLMLAAVLADGETIISNAAYEPHVSDLARLLVKMGADISGIDTKTLVIRGVDKLRGATHRVVSDHTEAGSLIALAAATKGEVTVTDIDPQHYRMTALVFERLGVQLEFGDDWMRVGREQDRKILPDFSGGIPTIDDGPWPHFPSDLMSVCIVLATQMKGTALFFEKMYESRMYFVDRLIAMGANAVVCDPHRVVVVGPAQLHGTELVSPDIRAGIALLGAALCAKGTSLIRNVHLIDRGYEKIEQKLTTLGARIERLIV